MSHSVKKPSANIITTLKRGGIVVVATDTLYGILGSALRKKTVARIYRLRKRNMKKPMIILIRSLHDLGLFGVTPNQTTTHVLEKLWPGKVSVILPIAKKILRKRFEYLHRGTATLAFRLPRSVRLHALLKATGPLVAPSANPEGSAPAKDIQEARNYFGDRVDAYQNSGRKTSSPSTLVSFVNEKLTVLRKGAVRISKRVLG